MNDSVSSDSTIGSGTFRATLRASTLAKTPDTTPSSSTSPGRCQNSSCKQRGTLQKGLKGLLLCTKCWRYANQNGRLRGKSTIERAKLRSQLLKGNHKCSMCKRQDCTKWECDFKQKRLVCSQCMARLRRRKGDVKRCENPGCSEVCRGLKPGPGGLMVCPRCSDWSKSHGGRLRTQEDLRRCRVRTRLLHDRHVCGNPDCPNKTFPNWRIDYAAEKMYCEDCYNKLNGPPIVASKKGTDLKGKLASLDKTYIVMAVVVILLVLATVARFSNHRPKNTHGIEWHSW